VQLAVNKDGVIRGNYQDLLADKLTPIIGSVDKETQRVALKIEGNANHPVSLGKTCARGQVALEGLYNPDRIQHPGRQSQRGR